MNITADLTLADQPKLTLLMTIAEDIARAGLTVTESDLERPWGAFYVIDESEIEPFAEQFFPDQLDELSQQLKTGLSLTPKILIVAPKQSLSWQYHHRRSEIWRVVAGPVGVVVSDSDELPTTIQSQPTHTRITIAQGQRHRLIGLGSWGIVAEIWQHIDHANPSNEADIVRIQDQYGR